MALLSGFELAFVAVATFIIETLNACNITPDLLGRAVTIPLGFGVVGAVLTSIYHDWKSIQPADQKEG